MKSGNSKKKSRFICLRCMKEQSVGTGIQRISQREYLHIKDLGCLCNHFAEDTKQVEVRYCDNYAEIMELVPDLHNKYYDENNNLRKEYRIQKSYLESSAY